MTLGIICLVAFALLMAYSVGIAVERGRHARESLRIHGHVSKYVSTTRPPTDG